MAEDYPPDDQNWRGSSPLSLVEEEAVARIARRAGFHAATAQKITSRCVRSRRKQKPRRGDGALLAIESLRHRGFSG